MGFYWDDGYFDTPNTDNITHWNTDITHPAERLTSDIQWHRFIVVTFGCNLPSYQRQHLCFNVQYSIKLKKALVSFKIKLKKHKKWPGFFLGSFHNFIWRVCVNVWAAISESVRVVLKSLCQGVCVCVCVWGLLLGLIVRSNLHAHGFQGVPAALPVHPHHAVVCAVLGHSARVSPADIIPAVRIGRVAAVVPPTAPVLLRALLTAVARKPRGEQDVSISKLA